MQHLRTAWRGLMASPGMPFVQTSAPVKVFEKAMRELRDREIDDESIIESFRLFAVDARRGAIKRDKHPWFSYWARVDKYIKRREPEQEAFDWSEW